MPLFQRSIDCHVVPDLWKKSIIIPIPKVSCPTSNKDFRPIALTSNVMKCFERVIVNFLKEQVAPHLDPCLQMLRAYARVLFADLSSAFDTLRPDLLVQKLLQLNVNPHMIKLFHSLLTMRPQQVTVNGSLSCTKYSSIN